MERFQIEQRLAMLEKQLRFNRYTTYGLLVLMIPIFLMGQVIAQNEVINVGRIVASEFVLSKDGKEYGKWHLPQNDEASFSPELVMENGNYKLSMRGDAVRFETDDSIRAYLSSSMLGFMSDKATLAATYGDVGIDIMSDADSTDADKRSVHINPQVISIQNTSGAITHAMTRIDQSGISIGDGAFLKGIDIRAYNKKGARIIVGDRVGSNVSFFSDYQNSNITISDSNDISRVVIENVEPTKNRAGDTTIKSASQIILFNEEGNVIDTMPR